jgi:hypothetical protein
MPGSADSANDSRLVQKFGEITVVPVIFGLFCGALIKEML